MVTASEFITIPYTPDLTQAGITFVCRSLVHAKMQGDEPESDRLRRTVAQTGVDLAFRRLLLNESIPHNILNTTQFINPGRYQVALGGRRCDIHCAMIDQKKHIRKLRKHPEVLLETPAVVGEDQTTDDWHQDEDVYIFAFLTALITRTRDDLKQALAAHQPTFLIHPFPQKWSRPPLWRSLGKLAIKTETTQEVQLEIGGYDSHRKFRMATVSLPPGQRVQMAEEWHAISYLSVEDLPEGRIGIHSSVLENTYIVKPYEWNNIWVYGMEIILVGYMTRGEFRRKAKRFTGGDIPNIFRKPTNCIGVPILDLRPLPDLFIRAQNWARKARRN